MANITLNIGQESNKDPGWGSLRWQDRGGEERHLPLLRASQRRIYPAGNVATHSAIQTNQRTRIKVEE